MSKLSTKDVTLGGGASKFLQPGNQVIKIDSISLETPNIPGMSEGYNFMIHAESEPLENFEGLPIDRDAPDGDKYLGQIGRIRGSRYIFNNTTLPSGRKIERDVEILKLIKNLCIESDNMKWFDAQDKKHDLIEDFIDAMNADEIFKGKLFYACVAGKQYTNKTGYVNYDLYLPPFTREGKALSILEKNVTVFDPKVHILETAGASGTKVDIDNSDDLAEASTTAGDNDFEL